MPALRLYFPEMLAAFNTPVTALFVWTQLLLHSRRHRPRVRLLPKNPSIQSAQAFLPWKTCERPVPGPWLRPLFSNHTHLLGELTQSQHFTYHPICWGS